MGKSCCAVGCSKRFAKGCGFKFYRFPKEPERRRQWIAAVNRKNWQPSEYSWICSSHFVGGKKLNDPIRLQHTVLPFSSILSLLGKEKQRKTYVDFPGLNKAKGGGLRALREREKKLKIGKKKLKREKKSGMKLSKREI